MQDFIDSLELTAQSKVYNTIELLREYGVRLGTPHVKKIGGSELWELRILGSDSLRVLYVAVTGKAFLLLHGFKKKREKTSMREIKTAKQRFAEYKTRLK